MATRGNGEGTIEPNQITIVRLPRERILTREGLIAAIGRTAQFVVTELDPCTRGFSDRCFNLPSTQWPAAAKWPQLRAVRWARHQRSAQPPGEHNVDVSVATLWAFLRAVQNYEPGLSELIRAIVALDTMVGNVGKNCFDHCEELVSVVLPPYVTKIGNRAFCSCAITELDLPNTLKEIGDGAFMACKQLKRVKLPPKVERLGNQAFAYCSELLSMPTTPLITRIPEVCFAHCTSLTVVDIPDGVIHIGFRAFADCTGLTSLRIPPSVKHIGGQAMTVCTSLKSIDIPDSVNYIGSDAFDRCIGLETVVIRGKYPYVGDFAFANCTALKRATLSRELQGRVNFIFALCPDDIDFIWLDES